MRQQRNVLGDEKGEERKRALMNLVTLAPGQ